MLRLLSHNWKRVLQELIDEAQCIVLCMTYAENGGGVEFEMGRLRRCQEHQSILVLDTARRDVRSAGLIFTQRSVGHAEVDWDQLSEACDFVHALKSLARREDRRKTSLPPMKFPPCYVVDKDLTGEQVLREIVGSRVYQPCANTLKIMPRRCSGSIRGYSITGEPSRRVCRW